MNFTINRELLLQNLNSISKALSNKIQMPALTGIKFDVYKDFLVMTSSNNEISIQTKIESSPMLKIVEGGTFLAPGRYLIDLVRKTDSKNIDFVSFEENSIKILADKSNFTLNSLDVDAYPSIAFNDSLVFITLDAINLKQIIRKTTFATSLSESRIIFTGVSFTCTGSKLEIVATDSLRLAKKELIFDHQYPEIKVVIPSRSLDELNKIVEDGEELVEIHITSSQALFKYRNILFQTRLIEGNFPNTSSIIPVNFSTSVTFNKNDLISSIERAAIFTNVDSLNIIQMTLGSDLSVEIFSPTNEIGAAQEEITPIHCTHNVPLQIALSSKHFLEALRSFDSDEVTLHFTGEIKPLIITGEDDHHLFQLILPVRAG